MGKNPNSKLSWKTNSRTRRKRWKRRKNRNTQAPHPTARFLGWFPPTSNGLLTVASRWGNVLTGRERIRPLRQGRPTVPIAQATQPADASASETWATSDKTDWDVVSGEKKRGILAFWTVFPVRLKDGAKGDALSTWRSKYFLASYEKG